MRKSGRTRIWFARTIVPPGNVPPIRFAVVLARGDTNNIGPTHRSTLAIFAECAGGAAGCSWPTAESRVIARAGSLPEERAGGSPDLRRPIVANVVERSSAAQGGLRAGDRILAVNDVTVDTIESFRARVQDIYLHDPVRLRVDREGASLSLTLPPAQPRSPR